MKQLIPIGVRRLVSHSLEHEEFRTALAFLIWGSIAALIDLAVFSSIVSFFGRNGDVITAAKIAGLCAAIPFAFIMHSRFTFPWKKRLKPRQQVIFFFSLYGGLGVVQLLLLPIVLTALGTGLANALLANLAVIGLSTLIRFATSRVWIFSRANPRGRSARWNRGMKVLE